MNVKKLIYRAFVLLVSVSFALLVVSCETEPRQRRGSLSDAMNKSKDANSGSRDVPEPPGPKNRGPARVPGKSEKPAKSDVPPDSDSGTSSTPFDDGFIVWGARAGSTFSSSGDMGHDFDLDLIVGMAIPKSELLFYAGIKTVDPVEDSDLDQSVSGSLLFLRLGGEIRYLPFAERSFLSPYIGAGVGGFLMGWSFQNALTSSTETIHSDSLNGMVLSVITGMYIVRNDTLSFGIAAIPEVYLFDDLTSEGFNNDYFKPYGTVKFVGELLFR